MHSKTVDSSSIQGARHQPALEIRRKRVRVTSTRVVWCPFEPQKPNVFDVLNKVLANTVKTFITTVHFLTKGQS
jgi:hypothetical protein